MVDKALVQYFISETGKKFDKAEQQLDDFKESLDKRLQKIESDVHKMVLFRTKVLTATSFVSVAVTVIIQIGIYILEHGKK